MFGIIGKHQWVDQGIYKIWFWQGNKLKVYGVGGKLLYVVKVLCWDANAVVNVNGKLGDESFRIHSGVKQCCVLITWDLTLSRGLYIILTFYI